MAQRALDFNWGEAAAQRVQARCRKFGLFSLIGLPKVVGASAAAASHTAVGASTTEVFPRPIRRPALLVELMAVFAQDNRSTKFVCPARGTPLTRSVLDLGSTPLANSYLTEAQLTSREPRLPLHVFICEACLLVQLDTQVDPEEIFSEYAYFSSYSTSWLKHARR